MENPYEPPSADAISAPDTKPWVDGDLLVVRPGSVLPQVCLRTGGACTEADRVALDLSRASSERWAFKVNGFVVGSVRERWLRNKRFCALGFWGGFFGAVACLILARQFNVFWLYPVGAMVWLTPFCVFTAWRQQMGMMGLHVERMREEQVWLRGCHPDALAMVDRQSGR